MYIQTQHIETKCNIHKNGVLVAVIQLLTGVFRTLYVYLDLKAFPGP